MYVGVYAYLYTYVYGYMRICPYACVGVKRVFIFICMCLVACCSDSDPFVRSKLGNMIFGFVSILDAMHRRFEDRFMGWSVDQYGFMQWRPDGDSVSKPRHFMWVFVLMSFSFLPLLCFIRIISCDFILYFTSLTCCITSWGICNFYLIWVVDMSLYRYHFMCW